MRLWGNSPRSLRLANKPHWALGTSMAMVEHCIEISAPATLVGQISQDYSVRYEWDPFPESISVVRGSMNPPSVGTQVLVRSKLGMEMLVEFVQVVHPNRAAIKMVKGPFAIAKFAGSWIFEDIDGQATVARFRYSIATRPVPLSWLGDRLAAAYFSRTTKKRLCIQINQRLTVQPSGRRRGPSLRHSHGRSATPSVLQCGLHWALRNTNMGKGQC